MIPRIVHRIWFGDKPIPDRYEFFWEEWNRLHPGWVFHTWTEDNLPEMSSQIEWVYKDIPDHARSCGVSMSHERAVAVQRADVVAYELIYQFGGIYVNCDIRPLKSFEPLLDNAAFVGMEDSAHICNAVMAANRMHPMWHDAIVKLPSHYEQNKHRGMEPSTGPMFFTKVWSEADYDVTVYPISTFYPVHFTGLPWGTDASDYVYKIAEGSDSYAVHSWGHRWQEGDPIG